MFFGEFLLESDVKRKSQHRNRSNTRNTRNTARRVLRYLCSMLRLFPAPLTGLPPAHLKPQTSNLKPKTSNRKPQTSNLKPNTSLPPADGFFRHGSHRCGWELHIHLWPVRFLCKHSTAVKIFPDQVIRFTTCRHCMSRPAR